MLEKRSRPNPLPWGKWRSAIRRISLILDGMNVARISDEDGSVLYLLLMKAVRKGNGVNIINVGVGYSTLWLTMPLEDLCIKSTIMAIELDG